MNKERLWTSTKETLVVLGGIATIVGTVVAVWQFTSSRRERAVPRGDDGGGKPPGSITKERSENYEANTLYGWWRLPLSGRRLRIEPQAEGSNRLIISDETSALGFGEVQDGILKMHLRTTKVGAEDLTARDAYFTLRLSSDGTRLIGDFHGEDASESGPVLWVRQSGS